MNDWQTPGATRYGAQTGRNRTAESDDYLSLDTPARLHLRRVRLDFGGYDQGGAYWGHGEPLYCAWDADGVRYRVRYLRAATRDKAKAAFPAARFYR